MTLKFLSLFFQKNEKNEKNNLKTYMYNTYIQIKWNANIVKKYFLHWET